jgi:hypothetical protein
MGKVGKRRFDLHSWLGPKEPALPARLGIQDLKIAETGHLLPLETVALRLERRWEGLHSSGIPNTILSIIMIGIIGYKRFKEGKER